MVLKRQVNKYALILLCIVMAISVTEKKVYARRYFLIERPMLGFDLSYEFEEEERRGPDISREDATHTLSERFDIKTEGWIYLPALAVYTLRLSPQWEQTFFHPDEEGKRTARSFLQGYFAEFIFLQYKPYTLRLFADRHRSTLLSSFAQRSKTESDAYGAALMLKYRILPTTIDYNHEESSQRGFFTTDRESDKFRLNIKYDKHFGQTLLDASYTDTAQTTQGTSINLKTQNATIQNYSNLTKNKRITLSSGLGYSYAEGDIIKNTGYGLSENLQWRHMENLSTNYTLRYDKNTSEAFTTETKGIDFNLTHLLYETLLTSIDADASSNRFTGGETSLYRAGVDFNYNREVPKGMLNISMGYNYGITNQDFLPGYVQVLDESITLTDGVITLLANKNIDINSITVTDSTGTIIYIKDIDYRVTEIDSFVRISRIIGGRIDNGQVVFVDYRYLSNPPFDYSTFSQYYGISLNLWSAWRIFYRFNRSEQRFISGTPPGTLTDDSIHTIGTELDWKWSRSAFEFEDRQTIKIPIKKWRIEETITLRPSKKTFLNLSGNYGENKFKETGDIERFNDIRSNLQLITNNWSKVRFEGFRNKISGPGENSIDSGFLTAFEWAYRIWSGGLSYRFLNEENRVSQQTRKNHYVLFEVKRTLF